ncbi:hypothetical protein FACS1894102_4460 [Spirochaetia bacterium]|nr:hypothetical protein FACS1894102_4460 [Spirochaetia bacterium]
MREYKARYKEIASIGRATWANYKEIERINRKAWIARIMDEALKEEAEGKTHAAKRAQAALNATETELEDIKNGNLVERFLDKEAMFRDWDRRFGKMGDARRALIPIGERHQSASSAPVFNYHLRQFIH